MTVLDPGLSLQVIIRNQQVLKLNDRGTASFQRANNFSTLALSILAGHTSWPPLAAMILWMSSEELQNLTANPAANAAPSAVASAIFDELTSGHNKS